MTSRNFGINSGRAGPSGASGTGTSASRDKYASRGFGDALPPHEVGHEINTRERAAFAFAALWASPFIALGCGLFVWSLFFT